MDTKKTKNNKELVEEISRIRKDFLKKLQHLYTQHEQKIRTILKKIDQRKIEHLRGKIDK